MTSTTGHPAAGWHPDPHRHGRPDTFAGPPRRTRPADPDGALTAAGIVVAYTPHEAPALRGVDVRIAPGEHVAIMGPSGSGKTTLLHVLAGILRPTGGSVTWRGRDIVRDSDAARTRLRREDFGFVFQSGHLLPELPAVENVALPLLVGGARRREAIGRATALFPALGLGGLERRRPGELSGGQAQRVAIARALVASPGIVFADEPTGALDSETGADVMRLLTGATRATGAALVVVTHDRDVAARCERTVELRDGLVVQPGRRPDPLQHRRAATAGPDPTSGPATGPTCGPATGAATGAAVPETSPDDYTMWARVPR